MDRETEDFYRRLHEPVPASELTQKDVNEHRAMRRGISSDGKYVWDED